MRRPRGEVMESWISKRKPLGGPQGGTRGSVGKREPLLSFFFSFLMKFSFFFQRRNKKKNRACLGQGCRRYLPMNLVNLNEILGWGCRTVDDFYFIFTLKESPKKKNLEPCWVAEWFAANVAMCAAKEALKEKISDLLFATCHIKHQNCCVLNAGPLLRVVPLETRHCIKRWPIWSLGYAWHHFGSG